MFCVECGATNTNDAKFCTACGKNLTVSTHPLERSEPEVVIRQFPVQSDVSPTGAGSRRDVSSTVPEPQETVAKKPSLLYVIGIPIAFVLVSCLYVFTPLLDFLTANDAPSITQEEATKLPDCLGSKAIDYASFYVLAMTAPRPAGERFCFRAKTTHSAGDYIPINLPDEGVWGAKALGCHAEFDTKSEYEQFLRGQDFTIYTIVASMDENGNIQCHSMR
jgi:hypothetical protein